MVSFKKKLLRIEPRTWVVRGNHSTYLVSSDVPNRNLFVFFRLAQFYKDVELAEVMTDNSPKVGEILQLYEIEGEDWSQDKDGGDDEQDDDEEDNESAEARTTTSEESSPTENRNPNSGSAGSKKRQSQTPQRKPAAKKKKNA